MEKAARTGVGRVAGVGLNDSERGMRGLVGGARGGGSRGCELDADEEVLLAWVWLWLWVVALRPGLGECSSGGLLDWGFVAVVMEVPGDGGSCGDGVGGKGGAKGDDEGIRSGGGRRGWLATSVDMMIDRSSSRECEAGQVLVIVLLRA